jgi:hypothetical protein
MRSFRDYEWGHERVGDSLSAAVRTAWRTEQELLVIQLRAGWSFCVAQVLSERSKLVQSRVTFRDLLQHSVFLASVGTSENVSRLQLLPDS